MFQGFENIYVPPKELIRKLLIVNDSEHNHQFSLPSKLFFHLNSFIWVGKFCVYHKLQTESGAQIIHTFFINIKKMKTLVNFLY